MSDPVGGLRARLLQDSFTAVVFDGMRALGWFDEGRRHRPLTFLDRPVAGDEPIRMNTLTVTHESSLTHNQEVGSDFTRDVNVFVVDVYAENDSLGMDLSNDIRDLLRGRLDVGPSQPTVPIFDYRMATPAQVGYGVVDSVAALRNIPLIQAENLAHWFRVYCVMHDFYYGASLAESPPVAATTFPSPTLFPAPDLMPISP